MTAKYKHTSISFGDNADTGFSEPIPVAEGRAVHFSVVSAAYVGQAAFQVRFKKDNAADWRTLTHTRLVPAADLAYENGSYFAAVDLELRVGLSAHTSGAVLIEGRVSREGTI